MLAAAHSHVEFSIRHLMIATVKGRFAEVSGTLIGDESDPEHASVELTIPVASIDTRESQRDTHLRSADFFDAERFPTIRFQSVRITGRGDDRFTVTVVQFPMGQTADDQIVEHAAATLRQRGEVRFQAQANYDPGMPGRQLNIFEPNGRQHRASVYMADRYLTITEANAAEGDFNALQFEQSITLVDAMPGRPGDVGYNVNGAPEAWCYPLNLVGHNLDFEETGGYWASRNLRTRTFNRPTPLLLTQGFLETNTRWDGASDYFNSLPGTQNRAWYGQFDHCRGWETQSACTGSGNNQNLAVGRARRDRARSRSASEGPRRSERS